jgi:PadR family transcriptional regulator PadR
VYYIYIVGMVHRGRHGPRGDGADRRGHGRGGPRAAPRGGRCRWFEDDALRWRVHARIERFVEPALLLTLAATDAYGYELAARIEELDPDDRVDLGNLYRLLRGLEAEGFVTSRWRDDLPGRSKRTYQLTDEGRALLDAWIDAIGEAADRLDGFLAIARSKDGS